jgi:RNA polymerase sigma factor (sigma-70 family)
VQTITRAITVSTQDLTREESEYEYLFAEAREYGLLSAEEERQIDGSKWQAIDEMQAIMLRDRGCRHFIACWAQNCVDNPPELSRLQNRDHFFLLRRELAEVMSVDDAKSRLLGLAALLQQHPVDARALTAVRDLDLPASLVAAMAEWCGADEDAGPLSSAADALQAWQMSWQGTDATRRPRLKSTQRRKMNHQLEAYRLARSRLVMHNLRLVYSIAGRFRDKGVSFPDLSQEGTVGLIRAAEKFRHRKGYRFSTYAYNWITQAIRRCIADAAGQIRFPGHVQEQLNRLYGERARLVARTGVQVSDAELAETAGFGLDKVRELMQLRNLAVSLDAPRYDEEDSVALVDTLPDPTTRPTFGEAENTSLRHFLLGEISCLDPDEQRVVIARWGLHRGPALSRAEVAEHMAVSTEWVRQLERSALKKLRASEPVNAAYEDHLGARG